MGGLLSRLGIASHGQEGDWTQSGRWWEEADCMDLVEQLHEH